MLNTIPLLVIPFLIYNLVLAGFVVSGADPWSVEVMSISMLAGAVWTMDFGALLIVIALVLLFFEIVKATRTSNTSVLDHLLSTFVFIAYLVEFLLVSGAATATFFLLMVIAFLDVVAGFTVTIRSAGRDVSYN
ncbi:MAG TPA: hypothetical protein PKE65_01580 [Rhizobiaceae bacterium]|nr:hypothetical protein [Rhizobiaceae bacterium]